MDWWLIALIGLQFALIAFLVWLAVNYRQKTLDRRSEERLRVLERFGSGKEISEFLSTDHGGRFLELFALKPRNPAGMIIFGIVTGILALFLAGARS